MALKIRLARAGAKKRPYYRIVVADVRAPRDGRFIEKLGTYNPLLPKDHDDRVRLDAERIRHWLGHGALPSDRVNRFLDEAGIMKRDARNNPIKAKPGKKRLEREEARRQAEIDAKAAAKAEEAPAQQAGEAAEESAEAAPEPGDDGAGEDAGEAPAEKAGGDESKEDEKSGM